MKLINKKRLEITINTPEPAGRLKILMKRCWISDHLSRLSINEVYETVFYWYKEKNPWNNLIKLKKKTIEIDIIKKKFKSYPVSFKFFYF